MKGFLKMGRRCFSKTSSVPEVRGGVKVWKLLLGIAGTVGVAAGITHYLQKTNRKEYLKSYMRIKSQFPSYDRLVEDIARRDYEIPVIYTKDIAEKKGGESSNIVRMEKIVLQAQHRIALALSMFDNNRFEREEWTRKDGSGGGVVRHLKEGRFIEKGGVNVSVSRGELNSEAQRQMIDKKSDIKEFLDKQLSKNKKVPFNSASISSVIHPENPHAPTIHFNYRYFEIGEYNKDGDFEAKHWWFGGGCDLTPSILYKKDCVHFHSVYKRICEKFRPGSYAEFKRNCDDYFVIPYRKECRGIGGVFFDGLKTDDPNDAFEFVEEMANAFVEAYMPILSEHVLSDFGARQKNWQLIRRGRYAEFNTAIDRGTKFGRARENANIEAIHISMPLNARFEYKRVAETKQENALMDVLKQPRDWVPLYGNSEHNQNLKNSGSKEESHFGKK